MTSSASRASSRRGAQRRKRSEPQRAQRTQRRADLSDPPDEKEGPAGSAGPFAFRLKAGSRGIHARLTGWAHRLVKGDGHDFDHSADRAAVAGPRRPAGVSVQPALGLRPEWGPWGGAPGGAAHGAAGVRPVKADWPRARSV